MGQICDLRDLIAASCDFAVIFLVLFGIAAIIFFLKIFQADFRQPD